MRKRLQYISWMLGCGSIALGLALIGDVQPAKAQDEAGTFLPFARKDSSSGPLRPFGGACGDGYHLVDKEGTPGIGHIDPFGNDPIGNQDTEIEPAPETYRDDEYTCVPDQSVNDVMCTENGTALVEDGIAACMCDEGYGGASCEVCAQGYADDGSGVCTLSTLPQLIAEGATDSMIPGETRVITPSAMGISVFQWSVPPEAGCFESADGACRQTFTGRSAHFRAASTITDMNLVTLAITAPSSGTTPPYEWEANIFVIPAEQIPVSGYGDSRLLPIIKHLRTYMRHRCVGAASIGISRNGILMGSWGLGRMDGPAASDAIWDAGCGDPALTVNELADPVPMDIPLLIGSNTKYHTSAVLRWALKRAALREGGLTLTDEQILGLRPFDPDNYPPIIPGTNPPVQFPVAIVPLKLYNVFAGITPFEVPIADSTTFGGTSANYGLCDGSSVANGFADPQWQDVTIGHIISHKTGLQRSSVVYGRDVVNNFPTLRGLTTQQDFVEQEEILHTRWGNGPVNTAIDGLGYASTTDVYAVPLPTLEEVLRVLAGRCLRYPLGVHSYSNTSPAFSVLIIEQLIASGRFVAALGAPATHERSALEIFLRETVDIQTSATNGIFSFQTAVDVPGYTSPGTNFRDWNTNENSYYYDNWDLKQPHCVWNHNNQSCSFEDWRGATNGRIRWNMTNGKVPFLTASSGISPGTGSFMVEARDELKFLRTYRIGSYSTPSSVGQLREGMPNVSYLHNGSLGGGHSYARQIAASTGESMSLPLRDSQGNLIDDYTALSTFTCASQLPDGVDYIVSINQNVDRKCLNTPHPDDSTENICSDAYKVLDSVVRYGICQVNWNVLPTVETFAVAE